ncbi:chorismate synthase [bacterium]|nr:chorismate synthase [bacterium]
MSNTFGRYFRVHSFGESHGAAMGVVVDGCPAGVLFDGEEIQKDLNRRKPGQASWTSSRNEDEEFELLSGVFEGKTLGTPIAIVIKNKDQDSSAYKKIAEGSYRVGHADDLWSKKYSHVDLRGGGRASGRETVSRVLAGSIAKMFLKQISPELEVTGFTQQIFNLVLNDSELEQLSSMKSQQIDAFVARLPSERLSQQVEQLLLAAKQEGLSYGGFAGLQIKGLQAGLGEPVFYKLKSQLSAAMMSIGASAGVEFADAFSTCQMEGTAFHSAVQSGRYSGIRGGISSGETISLKVAFKPTSSVLDVAKKGRHDPCIIPRAVPVMEAMATLVLADLFLAKRLNNV